MRRLKRFLKRTLAILAIVLAGAIIFATTAFYLVPLYLYEGRLKDALMDTAGLALEYGSLRRVFPPGFELGAAALSSGQTALVRFEVLRASVSPMGFAAGSMDIDIDGFSGGGGVTGVVSVRGGRVRADLKADRFGFGSLPALGHYGLSLKGDFSGDIILEKPREGCPTGAVSLKGSQIEGSGLRYRSIPLPLGPIAGLGLDASMDGCKVTVEGLWVDGEGLWARLYGRITLSDPISESVADLTVEIIPKGRMLDNGSLLGLISRYRVSTNYYSIPVEGRLGELLSRL